MSEATNRLVALNGVVIPPPIADEIADALALDWTQWLDACRGDAAAVWALFYPRLVEAFDQVVADWWELPIDGVTNAERYPAAYARRKAP